MWVQPCSFCVTSLPLRMQLYLIYHVAFCVNKKESTDITIHYSSWSVLLSSLLFFATLTGTNYRIRWEKKMSISILGQVLDCQAHLLNSMHNILHKHQITQFAISVTQLAINKRSIVLTYCSELWNLKNFHDNLNWAISTCTCETRTF